MYLEGINPDYIPADYPYIVVTAQMPLLPYLASLGVIPADDRVNQDCAACLHSIQLFS